MLININGMLVDFTLRSHDRDIIKRDYENALLCMKTAVFTDKSIWDNMCSNDQLCHGVQHLSLADKIKFYDQLIEDVLGFGCEFEYNDEEIITL